MLNPPPLISSHDNDIHIGLKLIKPNEIFDDEIENSISDLIRFALINQPNLT